MVSARIASFLKERGWVLNLAFIALGAYFVAGAANAVVARQIRVVPTLDGAGGPHQPQPSGGFQRRQVAMTAIADRNLLNAKREIINPVEAAAAAGEPEAVSGADFNENDLKPCSIPASLRATLVAEQASAWSLAVLYDNATREPQVFSINDGFNQIAADAVLHEIRSCAVVVRRRDHFELCNCEGDSATPMVAMASSVHSAPAEPGEGEGEGVTKISETQYSVDRGEIDRTLTNLSQVATQARIVPSFKNGKPNGFKLFSIKPGSIYSKIGLMNGDVVQKINGYEMNSPDKALEIYQKLKDASSVSIDFQRRGQDMHHNYNIQ